MSSNETRRVGVREGYDLWAQSYDSMPNPVVAMDGRISLRLLNPGAGERILDAGCGTGRNLEPILRAGAFAVGLDFSFGMLSSARVRCQTGTLVQADLQQPFPLKDGQFDAALCALIGEHLDQLDSVLHSIFAALRPGGRFVFSVYHPELAAQGAEAKFDLDGVEYRLGAEIYTANDYLKLIAAAGFTDIESFHLTGDEELARQIPQSADLVGCPVIFAVRTQRPE